MAKVERSYQHVEPSAVGNRPAGGQRAGRQANTRIRAEQLGHRLDGVDPRALSRLIKELEAEGLAFEGAEASFELLIRRHSPGYEAPFRIVDYTALWSSARAASCSPRRRSRSRWMARCCIRRPTATAP